MRIINELTNALEPCGIKIIFYIDRLHIYLDPSTTASNLKSLMSSTDVADNRKLNNKLTYQALSHHAYLDRKLELFQPEMADLKFLDDLEGGLWKNPQKCSFCVKCL